MKVLKRFIKNHVVTARRVTIFRIVTASCCILWVNDAKLFFNQSFAMHYEFHQQEL